MPRPKKDGTKAKPACRRNLTELLVRKAKAHGAPLNIWDTRQPGLCLRIQVSGHRPFKVVYSYRGRARWYHIGTVGLADARRIAAKVRLAVAEGKDPLAERQAERGAGTFAELAERYLDEHAKKKNKSWQQADYFVRKHLLPRWARLDARSIARADVRAAVGRIAAPVVANQVLAAASAIFTWGVAQEVVPFNPCKGVGKSATKSRERVLADSELPLFWQAFDSAGLVRSSALKVLLLSGQRPGEVCHMRLEHIRDRWWSMPGAPDPNIGWPGTKNGASHRIWLPEVITGIIGELTDDPDAATGFVFANERGGAVSDLPVAMRDICTRLGVADKVTPHDLRRTHGSTITRLGFGRDAMNRIQNHREGGIADVYDRHRYETENRRIMEAVARHILGLAEGRGDSATVVTFHSH
jgi:integrase